MKDIVIIKLTSIEADLVSRNIDGWLDAGACEGGLEEDERLALHKTYDQIIKKLIKLGIRKIKR
jgi:hypothetical protein